MRFLFVSLFLFTVVTVSAQNPRLFNPNPFWEGKIYLEDNTVVEGLVKVPYKVDQKKVVYKETEDSKTEKFDTDDVKAIVLTSEKGQTVLFENLYVMRMFKEKKYKNKFLLLAHAGNDYVTFYQSAYYIVKRRHDKIMLEYHMEGGANLVHYIRKNKDDFARNYFIQSSIGLFKKNIAKSFYEAPDLVQKVENEELGRRDLTTIIDEYLAATNGMK